MITKRQLKNRLKNAFNKLALANLYKEEFIEELGRRGYEKLIDDTLDEIRE